mmetsp:Transcript_2786/g.5212  ORF Transcript_2786/g.5212 Transcript_2786/m.5212 type:complete len:260 (+) Transcript_2786:494-1273(+)
MSVRLCLVRRLLTSNCVSGFVAFLLDFPLGVLLLSFSFDCFFVLSLFGLFLGCFFGVLVAFVSVLVFCLIRPVSTSNCVSTFLVLFVFDFPFSVGVVSLSFCFFALPLFGLFPDQFFGVLLALVSAVFCLFLGVLTSSCVFAFLAFLLVVFPSGATSLCFSCVCVVAVLFLRDFVSPPVFSNPPFILGVLLLSFSLTITTCSNCFFLATASELVDPSPNICINTVLGRGTVPISNPRCRASSRSCSMVQYLVILPGILD